MLRNARQDAKMRQVCMTNLAKCTEYCVRRHVFVLHIQGSQRKSFASGVFLSEKTSKRQGYPLRCLVFWFKMGIYKGYPLWFAFLNSGRDKFKGYPWWFAFLNSGRDIIQRISFASPRFGTQAGWIRQGIRYVVSVRSWQTVIEIGDISVFSDQFADIFAHTKRFFFMIWMLVSKVCHRFVVVS